MVRLRGTNGAWALVEGGMGTVTHRLAENARRAGASLFRARRVASIDTFGGEGRGAGPPSPVVARGVTLSCGKRVRARVGVVAACDPWALCGLSPAVAASSADSVWSPPPPPPPSPSPPSSPSSPPTSFLERLDSLYVPATTFKLNLALSALPEFACLGDRGGSELAGPEHKTTAHLLAASGAGAAGAGSSPSPVDLLHDACVAALEGDASYVDASEGRHPPIEFYFHSAADPSVREEEGEGEGEERSEGAAAGGGAVREEDRKEKRLGACHSAALFVQLAPHAPGVSFLKGGHRSEEDDDVHVAEGGRRQAPSRSRRPLLETGAPRPASFEASKRAWTPEATDLYARSLLTAAEAWCPGLRSLVVDAVPYPPPRIEARFGITGGHIHHVQNTFSFGDRVPLRVAANLFFASAGAHPGGSVTGAPGHNAAAALLLSMPRKSEEVMSWPTIRGRDGGGGRGGASVSSSRWREFARGL